MSTKRSTSSETEEELRIRKLKAETELAERKLRESKRKWQRCGECGGHGKFKRSLGRTGSAFDGYTYDLCTRCKGNGGWYYYEK